MRGNGAAGKSEDAPGKETAPFLKYRGAPTVALRADSGILKDTP